MAAIQITQHLLMTGKRIYPSEYCQDFRSSGRQMAQQRIYALGGATSTTHRRSGQYVRPATKSAACAKSTTQPLRAPEEIWADIRGLEREPEGLLGEIEGGAD